MNPRSFFIFSLLFLFSSTTLVTAAERINTTLFGNLAVEGYDPVSYFTKGEPTKGKRAHKFEYNNATWRFESEENLERFKADPKRYAPQFGGFCAWAVSQGYTASIDPDVWNIVDNKLYLNYSLSTRERWARDIQGNIAKGRHNWEALKSR
jgi:YHS domain-containing protein